MLKLKNLKTRIKLAPYTTYKIGGPADYFVAAASAAELLTAIREARGAQVPYFILGTGANILIGDRGFRGLVIHNRANQISSSGSKVVAASGAVVSDVIEFCAQKGLSGLEHFAGIPSSIGGAIWQNLHFLAPDRESTIFIESVIKSAKILDENGKIKKVDKDFFKFGYDDSILHHRQIIVLEVEFQLLNKSPESIRSQIESNLAWRRQHQPQLDEFASCGSVFKKIEGVGAGRLIDKVGLKGKRIGGAEVSAKHANYLINKNKATATDVMKLIELVQKEVQTATGYLLEPEISFIGEF